jgi:capsular exopolysaccharide synthesis family protein
LATTNLVPESAAGKLDIQDYLRMISRRWWFILAVGVAAGCIGGVVSVAMPKNFRASATVVVPQEQQGVFLMGATGQAQNEHVALETQAVIASGNETARRTARSLAERTVGPKIVVDPTQITAAISANVKPPDLIVIEAVSQDQTWAREFANQTALSFLEIMDELRQKQATNAQRYLERQAELTRLDLDVLLAKKREYQRTWGVVPMEQPVTPQVGNAAQGGNASYATQIQDYRLALQQTKADLASAQARLATLTGAERQLSGQRTARSVQPNPAYASLSEQLNTAQAALIQLQARYTSGHPAVEEMQARIREIQEALRRTSPVIETTAPVDPARRYGVESERRAAEQQVAELRARVGSLQTAVSESDTKKSDILDKEGLLEQLQDQIALKRNAYQELLTQLEAKKLSVASERGRASMVDAALNAKSTSPSLLRSLAFSLALGLFLGFALALLMETLDDTVRRPEDVTRDPDLRFLGVVPWTGESATELLMVHAPKSPPAEAFRTLRSNINFATVEGRPRTILVTSAGASEGKSMVAANLAIAYAQAGESVLLVDADLRRPTQHGLFGLEATTGLTNVLVGELTPEQAVQRTEVENLQLLPSGPLPPNPAELLDSSRMSALLQELVGLADLVVMDSPPAIMLTDALLLASQVDKTILVAAAGQVTRDAFDEMVRLLRHARGDLLGVVLNKLKLSAGDYYYYYYYYYYDYSRPKPGQVLPPAHDYADAKADLLMEKPPPPPSEPREDRETEDNEQGLPF